MRSISFRGLLSRKLRTILTAVAIILGVSMISGTYVLTDTINNSFSQIYHEAGGTVDAVVVGNSSVQGTSGLPPPFSASLLKTVRSTSGVLAAEGEISDTAQLTDKHGSVIGATGGAPSLVLSTVSARFAELHLAQGHQPHGKQLALDGSTVTKGHLRLGDTVGISGVSRLQFFTLVGIVKYGNGGSIGGATLISTDLASAQQLTGNLGKLSVIRVVASPGVSPRALVARLQAAIPQSLSGSVKVQTEQKNADDAAAATSKALSSLSYILLAFGAIALFVGAFVIFNTFSITVAQRSRELALLRTIGASRGQVLRSVILEALLIGAVSSVLGLFAGLGIARGLNAMFILFGIDMPNSGTVVAPRTVVVALVVGILVTLVSGAVPAVRATRVPPLAALREGMQLPRGRFARLAPFLAMALAGVGGLLLAFGIFAPVVSTSGRLLFIGLGAVALFLGVAMLSPQFVRPLATIIGWPIERFTGISGRLARENTVRNPSRTAVTAAALMIGLALVGFVTIFAAELKQTADHAFDREVAGMYTIYNNQGSSIPDGVAAVVSRVPGTTVVSPIAVDLGRITGIGNVQTNGIVPATLNKVYHLEWKQGSASTVTALGPHDAIVDDTLASANNLQVGSVLHVTTAVSTHDTFTVRGIYKHNQILVDWSIPYATLHHDWQTHKDFAVSLNVAAGVDAAIVKARIERVLAATYPTAAVHSRQDLKTQSDKGINQLLGLIYVLLAMSILVSFFGIVNTLVLSIYERTREIGMLRAIGTTRGQLRWMIRWESVITAVIGAILGLLLGIVLAVLVTAGLSSQGIEFALPIVQLLLWVIFAILFGVVAAAFPARRAARLDVLKAVSYE
jgi:putative ABC transport system permease protein